MPSQGRKASFIYFHNFYKNVKVQKGDPGDALEKVDSSDREAIRFLRDVGEINGADRAAAVIYALAFLEPGELSLDELSRQSGYSLSLVSTKVKWLERLGHLKKYRKPHSRKIFVHMDKDTFRFVREVILERHKREFEHLRKLPGIMDGYRKDARADKRKLAVLESYHGAMVKLENVFSKALVHFEKDL